jgi:pimeloyl-ACP methyl ester carboxylesterase
LTYFFARLGGKLFGHFDVEERVPIEQVKKARVPIIFLHGDDDDFVPLQMSIDCHAVCSARKHLTVIPGAGHGLAFPVDEEGYLSEVGKFFGME